MRSGVTSSNLKVSAMAPGPEGLLVLKKIALQPSLVAATGLGINVFCRLQFGAAEGAEKNRIVYGIGLVILTVEAEQSDGHVKDALVVDRNQWLKILPLHRVFKRLTTRPETAARALRRHFLPPVHRYAASASCSALATASSIVPTM